MILTETASQELSTQHFSVAKHWHSFRLMVDVIARRHLMTPGDDAQGRILNRLESTLNEAGFDDGSPDARGV